MRWIVAALVCIVLGTASLAQNVPGRDRLLENAQVEVYKTVDDTQLEVFIFNPPGHEPTDRSPAIVFFFGGGWRNGSPGQFAEHCKYLASRGMVAMTADYRVRSRQGVLADSCVRDAKSAVRWIRANAKRLGVDPNKIVAAGGSAGGHLAACTGVIEGFDEPGEDASIRSTPNAMALFNPAVVLAPVGDFGKDSAKLQQMSQRTGVEPIKISPYHHVRQGLPPTIIFHGRSDTTVPYESVELFTEAMHKAGNTCELCGYDGQKHGFFNHGRGDGAMYKQTLRRLDEFLSPLGYLSGEPTIGK
jgi:acetyl esterase/lipase